MEKYRQFADGGTGVNPFVPPWSHYKAGVLGRCLKVVMLPVLLMRLLVLLTAGIWLLVAELVCLPLSIIPPLRRPVQWLLNYAGCCLALIALGFWFVAGGNQVADHRRLKLMPPKVNGSSCFDTSRGALVLANMQGLTDVLYLGMKLGSLLPGVASCCWSTIIWDHLFWRKVIDLPTILVRKLQGAEHTHTHHKNIDFS